jgi:microcystin-dependent protein
MADNFVAEIRIFGFNFPPRGWAFCRGQLLPISQNTALFSLIGTMYGGDGKSNFALPNLQGSTPLGAGQGPGLSEFVPGESGGVDQVTLLTAEIPLHSHIPQCATTTAAQALPTSNVPAVPAGQRGQNFFASAAPAAPQFKPNTLVPIGGGQAHNNLPPYLALNFCIALTGIFPPRP